MAILGTNRKSYMRNQTAPVDLTFSVFDLKEVVEGCLVFSVVVPIAVIKQTPRFIDLLLLKSINI